jgi:integrase
MPRRPSRPRVSRINLDVVRRAFRSLPNKGESDYYILEKTDGPCLRVRRTVVQMGVRFGSRFHIITNLHPDLTIEQVEVFRQEARRLLRRLQDEESIPGLARGRTMTLDALYREYMADFRETRGPKRSPQTIDSYEDVWRIHLLPSLGHLRLIEITSDVVRRLKREIPERVLERRPWAKGGGRYMANRALQQLDAALGFAFRMEWITRNPASGRLVPRFEESRAEDFLDDKAYSAIGQVLREYESRLAQGQKSPLPLRTLYALRLAIYTGVRHRAELLLTRLEWCHLDCDVPRIGIPRAKGDRANKGGGRWIFLGPQAVLLLKAIPRPPGSEHLTIPGQKAGRPLFRLTESWHTVLRAASLPEMPVKVLRHGFSTHSVGIIAPEHRAQLLGHQGHPMTDTVYLHRHGPDLARAAALVENHLRELLGDQQRSDASPYYAVSSPGTNRLHQIRSESE